MPRLPWPARTTLFGAGRTAARRWVDRVEEVRADEVALDQVADVGRPGDRDADVEAVDDQAAQRLSARCRSRSPVAPPVWLPSMITRGFALLPFRAGSYWASTDLRSGRRA